MSRRFRTGFPASLDAPDLPIRADVSRESPREEVFRAEAGKPAPVASGVSESLGAAPAPLLVPVLALAEVLAVVEEDRFALPAFLAESAPLSGLPIVETKPLLAFCAPPDALTAVAESAGVSAAPCLFGCTEALFCFRFRADEDSCSATGSVSVGASLGMSAPRPRPSPRRRSATVNVPSSSDIASIVVNDPPGQAAPDDESDRDSSTRASQRAVRATSCGSAAAWNRHPVDVSSWDMQKAAMFHVKHRGPPHHVSRGRPPRRVARHPGR